MARLILLFIIAAVVFAVLRIVLGKRQLSISQFFVIYASVMGGVLLLYLGLTGRLNPLFALAGVILPFAARILPWVKRGMQAFGLFRMARGLGINLGGGATGGGQAPDQSEIETRFLHVTLIHDTGMMDGNVREGALAGSMLSNLTLAQLLALLDECRVDNDSMNVLMAYLDREHTDWRQNTGYQDSDSADSGAATTGGDMTREEAFDILGLEPDADRDAIVNAHRKLIQKLHPDRGGSTYLAARINQAKEILVG